MTLYISNRSIYVEVTVFLVRFLLAKVLLCLLSLMPSLLPPSDSPFPPPGFYSRPHWFLVDPLPVPHCTVLWTSNDKQSLANKQQQTNSIRSKQTIPGDFSVDSYIIIQVRKESPWTNIEQQKFLFLIWYIYIKNKIITNTLNKYLLRNRNQTVNHCNKNKTSYT